MRLIYSFKHCLYTKDMIIDLLVKLKGVSKKIINLYICNLLASYSQLIHFKVGLSYSAPLTNYYF